MVLVEGALRDGEALVFTLLASHTVGCDRPKVREVRCINFLDYLLISESICASILVLQELGLVHNWLPFLVLFAIDILLRPLPDNVCVFE